MDSVDAFHAGGAVVRTEPAAVCAAFIVLAIRALQQASVSLRVNGVSIFGVLDGDEVGVRVDLFPSAVEASWRAVEALVSEGVVVLVTLALVAGAHLSINVKALVG